MATGEAAGGEAAAEDSADSAKRPSEEPERGRTAKQGTHTHTRTLQQP